MAAAVILVLDNRDSYTFNLVQLLRERTDREVRVVHADDGDTALALLDAGDVAGVVISPGPGHPDNSQDFAASGALIDAVLDRMPTVPLLGVCLGHQGLARRFGYRVEAAPEPKHGWLSAVQHTGTGVFRGVPQGTQVTRYHSLAVVPGELPDPRLLVTARSEDGVIQGLEIDGAPWFGVQFHPESVACEHGADVVEQFLSVVEEHAGSTLHVATARIQLDAVNAVGTSPHEACRSIYRTVVSRGEGSFWLDSALADADQARWSIVGDATGTGRIATSTPGTSDDDSATDELSRLQHELGENRQVVGGEGLPFRGGAVGWLGYELGLRLLGVTPPEERDQHTVPQTLWVWPERFVVVDHHERTLTVCVAGTDPHYAQQQLGAHQKRVEHALSAAQTSRAIDQHRAAPHRSDQPLVPGTWRDDRGEYLDKIRACQHALVAGESYELCLTNTFTVDDEVADRIDPLELFDDLRAHHPTPYAALIEVSAEFNPGGEPQDLAVVSASPERLLRGRQGVYSTKPIKGTAPRGTDPGHDAELAESLRTDAKTFAENLMIVDLLRNDLGRVCVPGTVEVTELMAVESYASVHQLVSTIQGVAESGTDAVDVTRALFPGGSMTGAPKLRSVQILTELEAARRGVYSGALGFFSADGAVELSIVIRTAVRTATSSGMDGDTEEICRWAIGAGGAIVLDSDPQTEVDEVELKASSLRRAMHRVAVR